MPSQEEIEAALAEQAKAEQQARDAAAAEATAAAAKAEADAKAQADADAEAARQRAAAGNQGQPVSDIQKLRWIERIRDNIISSVEEKADTSADAELVMKALRANIENNLDNMSADQLRAWIEKPELQDPYITYGFGELVKKNAVKAPKSSETYTPVGTGGSAGLTADMADLESQYGESKVKAAVATVKRALPPGSNPTMTEVRSYLKESR